MGDAKKPALFIMYVSCPAARAAGVRSQRLYLEFRGCIADRSYAQGAPHGLVPLPVEADCVWWTSPRPLGDNTTDKGTSYPALILSAVPRRVFRTSSRGRNFFDRFVFCSAFVAILSSSATVGAGPRGGRKEKFWEFRKRGGRGGG